MPRQDDRVIQPDSGIEPLDFNAYYLPASPMEPAVRAVLHMNADFDFTKLDLITDRWALTRLLTLANVQCGDAIGKNACKKFTFGAQVAGNTIVFVRSGKELVKRDFNRNLGYGQNARKEYFKLPAKFEDAQGYYRITAYRLGDVDIMLRHKADGQVVEFEPVTADTKAPAAGLVKRTSSLDVHDGGELVPLSSILEFNTFGQGQHLRKREKRWEPWISQCGHYVAAHRQVSGESEFSSESKHRAKPATFPAARFQHAKLADREGPPADVVERYHAILKNILEEVRRAAREGGGSRYMVTYTVGDIDPTVSICGKINALSEELCRRMGDGR